MGSRLMESSAWFYRALLRAYPPAFRQRFADEMALVFRTLCQDVYAESGAAGLAGLWLPVLWDWVRAALFQWRQYLFKQRMEMMKTNLLNLRDDVHPLTPAQAGLAALPFLLFGLSSMVNKANLFLPSFGSLPLWQVLILEPFLVFNWLVLAGLMVSMLAGFPRWGLAYLGWAILFGWWWGDMRFYGHELGWLIWLPLLGVMALALLICRSLQPMRSLLKELWKDWTIPSFAIYILYSSVFMIADENHNPYLLTLIAAGTLTLSLGAWGYFRAGSPLRRVLSLVGGLLPQAILAIIDNATWDYTAYYHLPQSDPNANLVGIIFIIVLGLLMAGNGLLAYWRVRRKSKVISPAP